ncbi:MAG: hypothetical protein IT327_19185 [Anaerolineae bacterium]|nr:hypothetical protein [Anaerolineae bacterium]
MEKPLQRNYVKATDKETGPPRYSKNWLIAKRAFFEVYSDRLEIGNWIIPYNEIQDIVLFETKQGLFSVHLLQIETTEKNYQIGFNPWVNPIEYIPLEVRREKVQMQYSYFSIALRLTLATYLLLKILEQF